MPIDHKKRRAKFLDYCKAHKINPLRCHCLCGKLATIIKGNKPSCDTCALGDSRNSKFIGNLWVQNPARVKGKVRKSLAPKEIGPFDPDFYGHRVSL